MSIDTKEFVLEIREQIDIPLAAKRKAQKKTKAWPKGTIIVSADSHAQALPGDYRPFVESRYREAFDAWAAGALAFTEHLRTRKVLSATFTPEFIEAFDSLEEVQAGGESGYWDFDRRV